MGATVAGGLIALRFRSALEGLMAFGSGVVLGVALLDLIPEALATGRGAVEPAVTALIVLFGVLAYLGMDRLGGPMDGRHGLRLGAVSLVLHSFFDGLGIGSAFQAAPPVGWLVAAGVIAHDLVDGSNTVAFSLGARASTRAAVGWLALDGLAPIVGVLVSAVLHPARSGLSSILALMAGGFLYIGAAHLIPQARSQAHSRTLPLAGAGLIFIFAASRLGAS
jgi:zinc transporter ZupT